MINFSNTNRLIKGVVFAVVSSWFGLAGAQELVVSPIFLDPVVFDPNPEVVQESCPSVSRDTVEKDVMAGLTQSDITAKYVTCLPDTIDSIDDIALATKAEVSTDISDFVIPTFPIFDTYFEDIDACGYHPQRRELECAIRIKQRFGFAGTPDAGPGSFQWVRYCVDYGNGLEPVEHVSAVHVHDEAFGEDPTWHYGVAVQADERLHKTLNDGKTLKARAILSWQVAPPAQCNYVPRWGNWFDFKMKLDP